VIPPTPNSKNERQRKLIARAGRYIAMATQIPFSIAAGYLLGYWLDTKFGTTWIRIVLLLVAIVGVFTQLIWQVLRDQKSK
jgi:membrane protein DedA with SNARE-associated domain